MELKSYQQKVIEDLALYLTALEKRPHLGKSFKLYWDDKGATGMETYKNNVPGVPHVCAKVPTAGGKTYIAVNAIKTIFDAFETHKPARSKMVVWLVPSLTILDQTVNALSDSEHPYRKRLNQLFKNRVAIYEKKDLLMGAGFSLDSVREQLSIVVMSFDSLRARNKEDRKIFQDNGYLASFLNGLQDMDTDYLLPAHDESSLINVLRSLKPLVIVDESHNAESPLSVEMMVNLNPDFILDLTATPKNSSNIFSYVDAMALKRHHMVKLPVIVANQASREAVIESALILRRQLESIAVSEEKRGGKYIRPIVLFQAQPRMGEDNTTFEKIKKRLIALGIPDEQIKIKTAEINELKAIDLMSRDCEVRYIITVNALKEGWDCPFAYVLASLADKSSAVDVEQILGRVLRMPYVQEHGNDLLNLSYVFTASNKFMDTIQSVVKALNRAGFSANDYRTMDAGNVAPEPSDPVQGRIDAADGSPGEFDLGAISTDWNTVVVGTPTVGSPPVAGAAAFVESVMVQATEQNRHFEALAQNSTGLDVPADLEAKMNKHKLKDIFSKDAQSLKLPQFFLRVQTGGWFEDTDSLQLLERDELLKNFKLSQADSNISFEDVESEMYRVDLEMQGAQNYAPKPFKLDAAGRSKFNAIILLGSRESQIRDVTARIAQLVGNMFPITDQEVRTYIKRVIESMEPEQIQDCLERDVSYVAKIKQKIKTLASVHAIKEFNNFLDLDKIVVQPEFVFPDSITPSSNAPALPKSLYGTEAAMGDFECRVINDIANIDGISWWHRNLSKGKGFRINGYLNHYPDFILRTKSGKIIVAETKGDDRDNTDSELKLKLGKLWESRAGRDYRYMMVFENNPIAGAERLSDALNKIRQL
jgi:type III restriction enzyme